MEIRAGRPGDVAGVLPMVTEIYRLHAPWDAAKFAPRDGFEAGYGRWLTGLCDNPRAVFLVAERDDGGLAGFVVGTVEGEIPVYRVREYGFVHDLWVDDGYRNEGVGRQMVMLAVERFAAMGVTQVRLETAIANGAARRLFERCGFRESVVVMLAEVGK